jgi:microsomal epoxide hydrolase
VGSSYNLIHWFKSEKGGHFAAMEQPEIFVRDLRNFKKKV